MFRIRCLSLLEAETRRKDSPVAGRFRNAAEIVNRRRV
jgi:hypothetical protein